MTPFHYTQVESPPPQYLAIGGAALDFVPSFNGTEYVPRLPVSAFNAGVALGRVSEINVTGSGGFAAVVGNRLNINIDKGFNARSTFPSVGTYQAVSNLDLGAGISSTIIGNTLTISTTAATPQIGLFNNAAGVGIVQSPGTAANFTLKSLVGLGGTTIQDFGSYIGINSVSGGGTISLNQTGTGAAIIVSPGTASAFSLKGLVGVNGISVQDFGNYLQINGAGAGGGYVHPSYTPQTFTPSLVGNVLTLAGFSRDSIGSTDTITPFSFTLPTGGGGIAGISLNGVGSYTNIQFSSAFSVVGNTVNAIGAGHTIGNGALGAGIVSLPGFAASHTLKGLVGGGSTTVTDMGSHILISSTGGSGGGSNTVEVRKDGVTINPAAFILNFTGAGVSVANGVGVEINIPGGSGSAGVSSFNGATGAISLIAGTNTSITNFGGGLFQINATAGSSSLIGFSANGLSVTSNSVSLAMASLANAGAMPAWSGISTQFLNGNGQWSTPTSNMPFGLPNDIMWHNGSGWSRHPQLSITGITPFFGTAYRLTNSEPDINHGLTFGSSIRLTALTNLFLSSDTADVRISSTPGAIWLTANRLGFFSALPVTRPFTSNDITSVRNALIALGLIQ